MKIFRYLLAIALVCALTSAAKADSVDFKMGVLDPAPQPNSTKVDSSIFTVTFGKCPAGISASGCFSGINTSDETFTNLDMTFQNTRSLDGQTPTCETDLAGSVFSSSSCSLSDNTYILDFSGGTGITPGECFLIVETGVDPTEFPEGRAELSAVPEPNSVLLLSTGMAMVGLIIVRRRGTAPRISMV